MLINDRFDSSASGWPMRSRPTWSAGYVDGHYELTLDGQPSAGVSTAVSAQNYRLSVDIIVRQGAAGVTFLSTEPAIFYRLLIDRNGMYAVQELHQDTNTAVDIVTWTPSSALKQGNDARNHLRIERQGLRVQFFANDRPLTEFVAQRGAVVSQCGMVLTAENGHGQATFDNLMDMQLPNG
jgi:hypothetical protein